MSKPLSLRLYLGFAQVSAPLWRLALRIRARRGREDGARMGEKLGQPSAPRPEGRLVWFHAVSVGESLSLMTLLRRLSAARPDLNFLLTTSTIASAQALDRMGLPPRVIHQYAPIDTPGAVGAFLAHWRPDAAVIAEADMWPVMLTRADRAGIPLLLLNTTITPRRYRQRWRVRHSYARLYRLFRRMLMQDDEALARFAELGAPPERMEVMGVLKSASDPLPDAPEARTAIEAALGDRPRWAAAVTRHDEDRLMVEAHRLATEQCPDLLMIIAPRQLAQADETEALARAVFPRTARRSRNEPLLPDTQVYIADTIGEMGLWYRIAPVAFLGHSLSGDDRPMSGKNPFEAMALGAVVLHGPRFDNFTESYRRLHAAGAVREVHDPAELAAAAVELQDPAARAPMLEAAAGMVEENLKPLQIALDRVQALADGRL